jgi:hypothetical protein
LKLLFSLTLMLKQARTDIFHFNRPLNRATLLMQ